VSEDLAGKMKMSQRISVRALVGHVFRSGDLDLRFSSSKSSVEGIHAHQIIRKDRPDTYVQEVPISYDFEIDGLFLTITGRIDGIYQAPDRIIIDEIKTTHDNLDFMSRQEDSAAWAQVKCYAYIYGKVQGLSEIDTQLTFYNIDTGEIKAIRRTYSLDELEVFLRDLVSRYLEWLTIITEWHRIRDLSIQSLKFPFDAYRPGQRAMAVDVYRTIENSGQLMIQAATGIGKTMAALFPSIKAMAEGLTAKIFYLTAKTTERAAAERALDELRGKGLKMKSITLTAKEKICFSPESGCMGEECEFAKGYFDRIQDVLRRVFIHDAFTREYIESIAGEYRVCPFELSLDLSLWVDCIICDYNYVFDPKISLKRFFQERQTAFTLIVDEAHNLEHRAREMFSAELRKQPFLDVRRSIRYDLPTVYKWMGRINAWLVKTRKRCDEMGHAIFEKEQPHELYPLLRIVAEEMERWLSFNIKTLYREKLLDLYFDIIGFLKIAELFDECYAAYTEKVGRDLRIKLFCIDPSKNLKNALKQLRATIFFSATMMPMDYYKNILGCNESVKLLELPSPFPRENLCVIISGGISTLYRHRGKTSTDVVSAILALVTGKKGNYLLFFPSYEYMMTVYEIVTTERPDLETIIQRPGMKEGDRDLFLGRFRNDDSNTLVGFVVMGGIFGEGIDLVGERLSGAVIVGVGLPGITAEREIIRNYFNEISNEGFAYAYAYPGINRVLQAAGRVIRSSNDRGVVLLIDKRFLFDEYQSLLPQEWQPVVAYNVEEINQGLERFWGA
jgi:DNA excision repair protein ERCC-2